MNEGLKKFAHVNKKAFEQYNNFTKQRDQLLTRREELEASASSIEDLVRNLDMRKDEAIERTFKQVARNFEEVFEKLVPAGRGRLIIQRRIDQVCFVSNLFQFVILLRILIYRHMKDDENAEDDVEDSQRATVDNYTGVSIKVIAYTNRLTITITIPLRFRSIQKWMKVYAYNNYLVAKNP